MLLHVRVATPYYAHRSGHCCKNWCITICSVCGIVQSIGVELFVQFVFYRLLMWNYFCNVRWIVKSTGAELYVQFAVLCKLLFSLQHFAVLW